MKKAWVCVVTILILGPTGFGGRLAEARRRFHGGRSYLSYALGAALQMVESNTQLKMAQELGFHFVGTSGLALALALAEGFGDGLVVFEAGPKLLADISVLPSGALLITPSIQPGYAMRSTPGGEARHFFDLQLGLALKGLLTRSWMLVFRPFGLDMHFDGTMWIRYELMAGVGVTF